MNQNTELNEIDLRRLGLNVVLFFKRYFKLQVLITAAGILIGIIFYLTSEPEYHTNMIATSNVDVWTGNKKSKFSTTDEIISIIKDLNAKIEEQSYTDIANRLGIDIETAQKITEIDASYYLLNEKEDEEEKNTKSNYFRIQLNVSDNTVIDTLSSSLKKYINSNEYFKKRYERRKDAIDKISEKLKKEQHAIDSMKASFYRLKMDNFTILGNQSYSGESVNLYKEIISNEILSDELSVFEVLTDFSVSEKNHNSLFKMMAFFGFLFWFISVLISISLNLMRIAKKYQD